MEDGYSTRECRHRATGTRIACVLERCDPGPTCEQRCANRASAFYVRCKIAGGGNAVQCKARAARVEAVCVEQRCGEPCVCTDEFDPVCGADGTTYGNACEAGCAGVEIVHDGDCREPCLCPDIYDPVCGVDGETYPNSCEARCAEVEVAHEGECAPHCPECRIDADCRRGQVCDPETHTCEPGGLCAQLGVPMDICPLVQCSPAALDPVCGEDGQTHANACIACCGAGVEIAHEGECRAECSSNRDCDDGQICYPPTRTCMPPCSIDCFRYDPVCGSDGVTYSCGEPDAACHGVEVAHEGECGVCFGDQDCSSGTHCNAAEICLPPPGCLPGEGDVCPAVCTGHCVP